MVWLVGGGCGVVIVIVIFVVVAVVGDVRLLLMLMFLLYHNILVCFFFHRKILSGQTALNEFLADYNFLRLSCHLEMADVDGMFTWPHA